MHDRVDARLPFDGLHLSICSYAPMPSNYNRSFVDLMSANFRDSAVASRRSWEFGIGDVDGPGSGDGGNISLDWAHGYNSTYYQWDSDIVALGGNVPGNVRWESNGRTVHFDVTMTELFGSRTVRAVGSMSCPPEDQ